MPRSIRKSIILLKLEATPGTDAAPTNTDDAVLFHVQNLSCNIEQQFAERDVVNGNFATPDQLPYTRRGTITFTVDAAGSGTAGTAPALGPLFQAVGMAETVSAGANVVYNEIADNLKTATIWCYWDGELRKFKFCTGNMTADFSVGTVPTFTFTFQGLVTSVTAASNPVPTLTDWKRPVAVGPANTSALTLGGTYAAGAISGGSPFNFKTLTFDLGNDVQFDELCTAETVGIYGRNSTLTVVLDLSVAEEVQKYADMNSGTTATVGFTHNGANAGSIIMPFFGKGVITGIQDNVDGNKLLSQLTMSLTAPTVNDAIRLVFK
jgi:hypothetical protein